MLSYTRFVEALAVLFVLFPHPAPPGAADAPGNSAFTFRKSVQEVRVAFEAQPADGRMLTPLTRDDIIVLEDGQPVSAITTFQRFNDPPLEIAILADASDSMKEHFASEMKAVHASAIRLVRPDLDRSMVITFATSSGRQPPKNLLRISTNQAEGQTSLYDTLHTTTQAFFKSRSPSRRIVLLFSDGEDNWSRHNLDDVIRAAQKREVAIYGVTAHSGRLEYPGDRVLRAMAESTGGRSFRLNHYAEIDKVLQAILNEMKSQYVVTFRPKQTNEPGSFHSLKIEPRARKLRIRARSGYYADNAPVFNEPQ